MKRRERRSCTSTYVTMMGGPLLGFEPYMELVEEVRARSRVLICLSTSSWGTKADIAQRVAGAAARPDLVSFHVGSMNRGDEIFCNPPEYQTALIEASMRFGVKPEYELFDLGQISRAVEIHMSAGFPDPPYLQFVLGVKGGCPAHPRHLMHLVESLPSGAVWSVAAVGRAELPLNLMDSSSAGR